ncbi:MAG: NAD(P)-dependent oxidoreductase [Gammaproteobacteria bacterium]
MKAGFVGLGAMGGPMARNLARAGMLAGIHNRTAATAARFATEFGVQAFTDLASLASFCDAVVLCVSADVDVLAVVDGLREGLSAEKAVIDCSTVAAETAREAARRLAPTGAAFLDCPVSGGTEGARDGTLAIMAGGDAAAFERARPLLEVLGRHVHHVGPVGAGQATKATNQIMVAGINQAVSEALAFAAAQGLPLSRVIDALRNGAAASWFLTHRGPNMVEGRYPLGFKVELHRKDLEICRAMAARDGVQMPIVEMTLHHYRRLLADEHGDEDISSLYRLKSAMFENADSRD